MVMRPIFRLPREVIRPGRHQKLCGLLVCYQPPPGLGRRLIRGHKPSRRVFTVAGKEVGDNLVAIRLKKIQDQLAALRIEFVEEHSVPVTPGPQRRLFADKKLQRIAHGDRLRHFLA